MDPKHDNHTSPRPEGDCDCSLDVGRGCSFCRRGGETSAEVCTGCYKLGSTNWLEGMPEVFPDDIFEVRFKNTRKSFYRNVNNLPLKTGDIVAVEASPGHDIGIVSLTGDLVARQMKRVGFNPLNGEFKKIYRKAKPGDIEKWQEAIALEHTTMIRSRQIAAELGLNMKIGDVEYQGDKIKAIFYYIADERVDFRELIKIFAEQFRIRIEMKQIGARQEAGRIGGLGSCGRELCCASWISSFVSVTTNAARHQEISLNPQKLAGQCGKLKCCLVYELDTYLDARKDFPRVREPLQILDGEYYLVKTDILSRTMWFSSDPHALGGMQPLSVERVKEIIRLNRQGVKPDRLSDVDLSAVTNEPTFSDGVGEESLTRFDKQGAKRRKGRDRKRSDRDNGGENARSGSRSEEGREARTAGRSGDAPRRSGSENPQAGGAGRPNSNRRGRGDNRPDRPQGSASKEERPNSGLGGGFGRSSGGSPGPPNRTDRPCAAKSNNGAAGDGDAGPTARTRTTTTLIRTAATGRTGFQRIPGTITAIETAPLRTAATTPGTARAQTVATTTVTTATEETPRRNKTRTPATEPWPGAHPLSETQLTSAEPDRQPTVTRPAFAGRRWPVRRAAPS